EAYRQRSSRSRDSGPGYVFGMESGLHRLFGEITASSDRHPWRRMTMALQAPHQQIKVQNDKETFLVQLFDTLYVRYRERMSYVQKYEAVVQSHGGTFVNDHIAFRTLASEKPVLGIFCISRIFEALGYSMANCYEFPDKHFSSIHFQHPN